MRPMKPYGLISDTHNHLWSAFSTTLPSGVNSRLQMILDDTKRCAAEVKKAGGDTMYHGGDLFHVRGSIAPSVLNPTQDCYEEIIKSGINIVINAGNHDLEGKEALRVSSAVTAMERIGCKVINRPSYGATDDMAIIPWIPNMGDLRVAIEAIDPADRPSCDLLLHAPIDGFMPGLPNHGLSDTYLALLGFRRVFSGHYHHHKDFGNGVYSIGALTHQTWGDINTKAGFLIVSDDGVKHYASHAPSFIEIDGLTDPSDIPLLVDGNYTRVKITSAKSSDVETMRQFLLDSGAKGVLVQAQPKPATTARTGTTLKAGATLDESVGDFIASKTYNNKPALTALCQDILTTARSV
jgi:DNA repair exonuclease SbcCD nuclease subunit